MSTYALILISWCNEHIWLMLSLPDFFFFFQKTKTDTEEKPNFKRWKKIITNYCMSFWQSRAYAGNKHYWTSEAYAFTWRGWQILFSSFLCRWRLAIIFVSSQKSKDKMTSSVIQYDNGNPGFLKQRENRVGNAQSGERKPQTYWKVKQEQKLVAEKPQNPEFPLPALHSQLQQDLNSLLWYLCEILEA